MILSEKLEEWVCSSCVEIRISVHHRHEKLDPMDESNKPKDTRDK